MKNRRVDEAWATSSTRCERLRRSAPSHGSCRPPTAGAQAAIFGAAHPLTSARVAPLHIPVMRLFSANKALQGGCGAGARATTAVLAVPLFPPWRQDSSSCRNQQVENLLPQESQDLLSFPISFSPLFPSPSSWRQDSILSDFSFLVVTRFHLVEFSKLKTCCHKRASRRNQHIENVLPHKSIVSNSAR